MKTRQQCCALLLAVCGLALSQVAWADTNNILALRFNFDAAPVNNVIVDTSPLANHPGAGQGATWAAEEAGRNGVMRFALPTVQQATIAPSPDFDGRAGTIAFWMKSAGNAGAGNDGAILFDRRSSQGGDVIVMLDDGHLFVQAVAQGLANSFATIKAVNDDQWHLVTYVFDQNVGGQIQLYIDGVLDSAKANTQEWFWDPSQQIELGSSHDGWWRKYAGSLDDFQFYSRALLAEEVQALANGTVDETSLVVRLDFAVPPVGDVLEDSSSLGSHPGTDLGATWAESVAGRSGVLQFAPPFPNQLTVPPHPELNAPQGAVTFWMKSAGNTGGGNEAAMIFDHRTGPGDDIFIKDNGTIGVQATAGPGNVANSYSTTGLVNDDQWHHVAYV